MEIILAERKVSVVVKIDLKFTANLITWQQSFSPCEDRSKVFLVIVDDFLASACLRRVSRIAWRWILPWILQLSLESSGRTQLSLDSSCRTQKAGGHLRVTVRFIFCFRSRRSRRSRRFRAIPWTPVSKSWRRWSFRHVIRRLALEHVVDLSDATLAAFFSQSLDVVIQYLQERGAVQLFLSTKKDNNLLIR